MAWEFTSDKPIFQQINERITMQIISGRYKAGDKLEPVRDLALSAGVNPNTMQRALADIEQTGLIYTKRGDGRYVSQDTALLDLVVQQYVDKNVEVLLQTLRAVGLTSEQILTAIQTKMKAN